MNSLEQPGQDRTFPSTEDWEDLQKEWDGDFTSPPERRLNPSRIIAKLIDLDQNTPLED